MPISLLVLSLLAVGSAVAAVIVARQAAKNRSSQFNSRELLPLERLCSAHFPNHPQQTVLDCLSKISRITGVEPGRLRPTDRFDKELKLPRGNFIAGEWDDIEEDIAKKSQRIRSQSQVFTIGDYVELMSR